MLEQKRNFRYIIRVVYSVRGDTMILYKNKSIRENATRDPNNRTTL